MKRPLSALRTGLLALFALTAVTRAWAQPLSFDLSATELSKALAQFNKQSNIPSVYIGGGGEEIRTKAVTGELEPLQALQRLETIAEMAVRMRETVRQLSDRWEGAGENSSGGNEKMAGQPPRPVRG